MIHVLGANPALDHVAIFPSLVVGAANRATGLTVVPGGKGLNLARAACRLGSEVAAYGFLGGRIGASIRELIELEDVLDRHTTIEAETRVCFIAVDPTTGESTVLNEYGPAVTMHEISALLKALEDEIKTDDIVVLAGSLPGATDPSVAAEVVALATEAGAHVVIDVSGETLKAATSAHPQMVKCNRDELAALLDLDTADPAAVAQHRELTLLELAAELIEVRDKGVDTVVVTLGADGALAADAQGVKHVSSPHVELVNATGCGDLFLAGLLVALERAASTHEAIALAAACGAAGATQLRPELPPGFDATAWVSRTKVSTLAIPA